MGRFRRFAVDFEVKNGVFGGVLGSELTFLRCFWVENGVFEVFLGQKWVFLRCFRVKW
jgi:hypothetical protein